MERQAIIRWGRKEAIIAEYGDHYEFIDGKWLVIGEDADGNSITPEGFRAKKWARADAHDCARRLGGMVLFVG